MVAKGTASIMTIVYSRMGITSSRFKRSDYVSLLLLVGLIAFGRKVEPWLIKETNKPDASAAFILRTDGTDG